MKRHEFPRWTHACWVSAGRTTVSFRGRANSLLALLLVTSTGGVFGERVLAEKLVVRVENLAPANGNFLTPVWVGFHDGGFDIYDSGVAASAGLERLAEDGTTGPLAGEFVASGAGTVEGTIPGPTIPPIAPGEVTSMLFTVDGSAPTSRYFSYASMVIPSNDAFIANGNPLGHEIFSEAGDFLGAEFIVLGSQVLDAGTEVNDEVPENTAFFGQSMPDTGDAENGTVALHPGFMAPGSGGILDDPMFAGADFTAPGYAVARISVRLVPEPGTMVLLVVGAVALTWGAFTVRAGRGRAR